MNFESAKVGDKVLLILTGWSKGRSIEEMEISRVGRKYVYIYRIGGEMPFHKSTGWAKSDFTARARITTQEGLDREINTDLLWSRIREKGFELRAAWSRSDFSDEVLGKIAEALEDE